METYATEVQIFSPDGDWISTRTYLGSFDREACILATLADCDHLPGYRSGERIVTSADGADTVLFFLTDGRYAR